MLNLQKILKYRRVRPKRSKPPYVANLCRVYRRRLAMIIPSLSSLALFALLAITLLNFATAQTFAAEYTVTSGDTTISMSIGGAGETEQVVAGRGSTAYRSHTVTINASNIEGYTLSISGSPNLTGATAIAGANNKTGAALVDNTWGYSYGETVANDSKTFKTLSTTATQIDSGKPANSTISNQTKNLVFAVKFGADATAGRYYANVNLSIAATPKVMTSLADISTMQEMYADVCAATPSGYSKTLRDARDNNSYTVAKLRDGNCWMTQNLRLAGSRTLTSADSDVTSNFTLAGSNISSITSANLSKSAMYYNSSNSTAYYNWYTATAGTNGPSGSVCPRGWKLPTGLASGQYKALMDGLSVNDIKATPYNFIAAGRIVEGSHKSTSSGYYWTGTPSGGAAANLYFNATDLGPDGNGGDRANGMVVRCVADLEGKAPVITPTINTIKTVATLQDVTVEVCENSAIGDTATLRDSRDNNIYTVGRLADGKCWMTQNLKLAGGTTINSTNSDLNDASSYTLPANKTSTFTKDNTLQQMRNASDSDYGARYSWCAATANTCQSGGTPIAAGTDATSSICPKGWKLPQRDTYNALTNKSSTWATNGGKNGRWLGATSAASGGGFFPAAGGIYPEYNLAYEGSGGRYWSRTANSTENAYYLRFDEASSGMSGGGRYPGYSVRCVVEASASTPVTPPVTPPTTMDTIKTITKMQDMTSAICNKSAVGDTATLTDSRDNSTYTVRKNEDNKCWMTQNLRIVNKTITSSDSDVSSNFTIPASNASAFNNSYNANSAYYGNDTNYGAYYSWYTATAGAGTQSVASGDVTPSICPKGWKLPSNSDYITLASTIGAAANSAGSTLLRNTIYKFQYSGRVQNGSLKYDGSRGQYWARTAFSNNNAYNLRIDSSYAGESNNYDKTNGFSVRCVAYSS